METISTAGELGPGVMGPPDRAFPAARPVAALLASRRIVRRPAALLRPKPDASFYNLRVKMGTQS